MSEDENVTKLVMDVCAGFVILGYVLACLILSILALCGFFKSR